MSLKNLAEHILAVGNGSVTNLQLQKTLFFTMGTALRNGEEEDILYFNKIYNNDFEKWRYGPVVPSLYFKYNHFGDKPINDAGKYHDRFKKFNKVIQAFLSANVYRLVAISHKMDAWKNYEEEILTGEFVAPYSFEEILKDFTKEG